jgi:hypothetical protein
MIWAQELICNPQAQADFQNQNANSRRDADPEPNRTLTPTDLYAITKAEDARSEANCNTPRREGGDSKVEKCVNSNDHAAPNY